jgi:hypothetical protein
MLRTVRLTTALAITGESLSSCVFQPADRPEPVTNGMAARTFPQGEVQIEWQPNLFNAGTAWRTSYPKPVQGWETEKSRPLVCRPFHGAAPVIRSVYMSYAMSNRRFPIFRIMSEKALSSPFTVICQNDSKTLDSHEFEIACSPVDHWARREQLSRNHLLDWTGQEVTCQQVRF